MLVQWYNPSSDPAIQRIILKIVGFLNVCICKTLFIVSTASVWNHKNRISIDLWKILISFFVKICYRKTCYVYFSLVKRKPRPWAKNDIAVAFRTFLVMRSIKSEAIKTVRISINCFGFHLILSEQSQGRAELRHISFIGNQSVKL